jgi:hypothetical protein
MAAFKWTTFSGETSESNEYPNPNTDISLRLPDEQWALENVLDYSVIRILPRSSKKVLGAMPFPYFCRKF